MRVSLTQRLSLVLAAWVAAAGCQGKTELTLDVNGAQGGPGGWPSGAQDTCVGPVDVGRVTLHRLNGAEYDNTVRDLLGDTSRPSRGFPADDRGYGFDNIADVLSVSPLLYEKYDAAAEKLVAEAYARDFTAGFTQRIEAEGATASTGGLSGSMWNLYSNGTVAAQVTFPVTGTYTLSARAYAQQGGPDPARMQLRVDGTSVAQFDVTATSAAPQVYQRAVTVTAGTHTVAVAFINDYYDAATSTDRNLLVDWFQASAPAQLAQSPRLRLCDPATGEAACARLIVSAFARKAWRRNATPTEVDGLTQFVAVAKAQGEGFDQGIRLALQAVLLSPQFLFRVELDTNPTSTEPHPLTDHELATRLSYFLWSSTPDEGLLNLADQGVLKSPAVLSEQVTRMLADAKARALVDNFAGQWLQTRAVDEATPDATLFPQFDAALKDALRQETELVFKTVLSEDRPLTELLGTDFTFLNDRLAAHYGLPAPGATSLTRVALPVGSPRGSVLGHGGFLTHSSHSDRTSPVRRGKWVLDQLLCRPPPPPPPEVEGLAPTVDPNLTLRERMELHRQNDICASCHRVMDPIGFGLENFDAIGRWRTQESTGAAIDPSGTLPDGQTFSGPVELATLLQSDPDLTACVARQMLTYALGRGPTAADHCNVQRLARATADRGGGLTDLVHSVVTSPAFTHRRGEAATSP